MLALSVSISTSSSPLETSSPSDLSHLRTVPSSMESDRRGIATSAMPRRMPVLRAPALLDAPEPPYGERDGPGEREQRDHHVADVVEVEAGDPADEAAVEAELLVDDGEQLDGADHQRDGDRQPGDREVVVELAHRPLEGP